MALKTHYEIIEQEANESDNQRYSYALCGRDEFEHGTKQLKLVDCKVCRSRLKRTNEEKGNG